MVCVLLISIFIVQNLVADATIGIIGPQKKPLKYVYEQGCYFETEDEVIPFNTTYFPKAMSNCVKYFCDFDEYIYVTECIQSFDGDCTVVKGNKSLHYPYCCDYCTPSNKRSPSKVSTEKNSLGEITSNNIKEDLSNNGTLNKPSEKNAKSDRVPETDFLSPSIKVHKEDTVAKNTSTTEININKETKNKDASTQNPIENANPDGDITPKLLNSVTQTSKENTSAGITKTLEKNNNKSENLSNNATLNKPPEENAKSNRVPEIDAVNSLIIHNENEVAKNKSDTEKNIKEKSKIKDAVKNLPKQDENADGNTMPKLLNSETQIAKTNTLPGITEIIDKDNNKSKDLKNKETLNKPPEGNTKSDTVSEDIRKEDLVAKNTTATENDINKESKIKDSGKNIPKETANSDGGTMPKLLNSLTQISKENTSAGITRIIEKDNNKSEINKGVKESIDINLHTDNMKEDQSNNETLNISPKENEKTDREKVNSVNIATEIHKEVTVANKTSAIEKNVNEESKIKDAVKNLPKENVNPSGDTMPKLLNSVTRISKENTSLEATQTVENNNNKTEIGKTVKDLIEVDQNVRKPNDTEILNKTDQNRTEIVNPKAELAQTFDNNSQNKMSTLPENRISNKEEPTSTSDTETQTDVKLDRATQTHEDQLKSEKSVPPNKKEENEN